MNAQLKNVKIYCHESLTPLSVCVPRSSNSSLEPAARSRTVRDARTSPAFARDITRAAMWTPIPPMRSPRRSISPVWIPARTLTPIVSTLARLVPDDMRRCLARPFYGLGIGNKAARDFVRRELRQTDPAALVEAAYALRQFSSHDWVGRIDVPTAVLVMEQDRLVAPARQRGLADSIPGARIHHLAAGHLACAERPDLFVPALVDACEAVSA